MKVIYEGEDFKRMLRTDISAIQRIIDSKKTGIFEVSFREKKIKIEIIRKGDDVVVRRLRII